MTSNSDSVQSINDNKVREFKPSKYRYFFVYCKLSLILFVFMSAVSFLFKAKEAALAFVLVAILEILSLWIESSWVEDNLSIVVTRDVVVGPAQPKLRWKLMKWKRIKVPVGRIDREKTKKPYPSSNFFSPQNLIRSLDGDIIFVDLSFTDVQIQEIYDLIFSDQS